MIKECLRERLERKNEVGEQLVLSRTSDIPIFDLKTSSGYFRKTSKMMKHDLERAGISYKDEEGLFADFHANRHTFISNLSRAGVSLATAQKLARHSDPKLTANRYTHLGFDVEAIAIACLPTVPEVGASVPIEDSSDALVAARVAVTPAATGQSQTFPVTEGIRGVTEDPQRKPRRSGG